MAGVLILTTDSCKDDDPGTLYTARFGWTVGTINNGYGTILHTKNGGETWLRQGDSLTIPKTSLADVCVIDQSNVWIAGNRSKDYGTILRTDDGGNTWIRQGAPGKIPDVDFGGITAVNNNICWVAGDSGVIMKTTDGGQTWVRQNQKNNYNLPFQMICAADENHIWAVGIGDTLGVILYSDDGGNNWTRQGLDSLHTGNLPNAFIDVHALNKDIVWTVGPGQAVYTLDGGKTWINKPTPAGPMHNNGVCVVNKNTVWVATDNNQIYKLTDLNGNWVQQYASDSVVSAEYMGVTAYDNKRAWIVTTGINKDGNILYTFDGGNTWWTQKMPVVVGLRRISFAGALR